MIMVVMFHQNADLVDYSSKKFHFVRLGFLRSSALCPMVYDRSRSGNPGQRSSALPLSSNRLAGSSLVPWRTSEAERGNRA
jgi:hypothetical protein